MHALFSMFFLHLRLFDVCSLLIISSKNLMCMFLRLCLLVISSLGFQNQKDALYLLLFFMFSLIVAVNYVKQSPLRREGLCRADWPVVISFRSCLNY